jgi:hypothetical protein
MANAGRQWRVPLAAAAAGGEIVSKPQKTRNKPTRDGRHPILRGGRPTSMVRQNLLIDGVGAPRLCAIVLGTGGRRDVHFQETAEPG